MSFAPPDIRLRPGSTTPQGPPFWSRLLTGKAFRGHAADKLSRNAREFGDLVYFEAVGRKILQFNHPELIHEMLVRDAPHHSRNLVMQRSKAVLGDGLLTSEEPLHMRQRRLAAPAFHRQRIAKYGEIIGAYTAAMTAGWQDGSTFDARAEMLLLALRIVGKTLFDTEVDEDVHRIAAAVDSFQHFLPLAFLPMSTQIQRLPIPAMRRIRSGREHLDKLIYGMIAERRKDTTDRGDLLSMLLASTDVEDPTARMSDTQVRDECLTILLAGHETTANALSFALRLLAENPEIQEQLAAECAAVLGGRTPNADDYKALPLAEQVFAEALRLYPPVWVTARTAAEDYEYRGFMIRKYTMLVAPNYFVQRDPRWWPEPTRFDPARWTADVKAQRPKLAFFAFGAGGRQCIGEGLAWMEGALILAEIAQHWRMELPAGAAKELEVSPAISMRPKGKVELVFTRRD